LFFFEETDGDGVCVVGLEQFLAFAVKLGESALLPGDFLAVETPCRAKRFAPIRFSTVEGQCPGAESMARRALHPASGAGRKVEQLCPGTPAGEEQSFASSSRFDAELAMEGLDAGGLGLPVVVLEERQQLTGQLSRRQHAVGMGQPVEQI
jgi:hypothetical protein